MTTEARDALAKASQEAAHHSRCPHSEAEHRERADAILGALDGWTLVPVPPVPARRTEWLVIDGKMYGPTVCRCGRDYIVQEVCPGCGQDASDCGCVVLTGRTLVDTEWLKAMLEGPCFVADDSPEPDYLCGQHRSAYPVGVVRCEGAAAVRAALGDVTPRPLTGGGE
jgi:hypothetical protein